MKALVIRFLFVAIPLCACGSACEGAIVDISISPSDWIVNDAHGWDNWTANYTTTTTPEGHLRITRTVANPGTGWCANLRTESTYAFTTPGMDYSVFTYRWRVNGHGTYCQTSGGPQLEDASGEANPWFWGPTGEITTAWSWEGSKVVTDNEWLLTQVTFNGDRTWSATTSYYGVPRSGGEISSFSGVLTEAEYEELGDMYLHHAFGDNYAAGQYVEIAEATIETVPEPATFALTLIGCGSLVLRRRSYR